MAETPSEKETERQYRVLQQTLSAHTSLRDGYTARAKAAEILLLVCATVFCATTFAGERFYEDLGISLQIGRLTLGIASVLAFASSLVILVVDWKGSAARHGEAADKWSTALEAFRKLRTGDGSWPEEARATLNAAYWEADRNSTNIPERRFNRLKARHLHKVEVSRLISRHPGCPPLILSSVVRLRGVRRALGRSPAETHEKDKTSG